MMSFLGNKKYINIFSFVIAAVFIISVGAIAVTSMGNTAMASPKSDIGIVDRREVVSANSSLASDYQQKLKETADKMQQDFDAKSKDLSDADKQKLFEEMQQQFNEKRSAIDKEMEDKINGAVKTVAEKRGLTLVVEKAAVIYGGTDITKDVSDALNKSLTSDKGQAEKASADKK